MLVADDPALGKAVRLALPRRYRLIGLCSAAALTEALEAYEPDVIILEARLPGQDGLSLRRRLRERAEFRHIPVIFLTDADETEGFLKSLEAHGDAYLPKPFDAAGLLGSVERLLGARPSAG